MNSYWFHRYNKSQSPNYSTTNLRKSMVNTNQQKQQIIKKQYQGTIGFLQKKANKITQFANKISKVEDFYQIMCGSEGEFNKIGIRCYQHNNQLILYCATDQKLLCANCMYSSPQNKPHLTKSPNKQTTFQYPNLSKSRKQLKQPKKHTQNSTKHTQHQVKQYQKSTQQISNNIKRWQYEFQQNLFQINTTQTQWSHIYQQFNKTKQLLFAQLNKQYDDKQMQLSKKYSSIKKQLQEISKQYQVYVNKIINAYKVVKKLLIPNRFPIPCVKHSWFQQMKKIIGDLPKSGKEENQIWIKGYEGYGRRIVKRLGNTANRSKTDNEK